MAQINTLFLKDLKKTKQKYFKIVNKNGGVSAAVYFVNHYDRESKKYSVSPFDDVNKEKFLKGVQLITLDFEF